MFILKLHEVPEIFRILKNFICFCVLLVEAVMYLSVLFKLVGYQKSISVVMQQLMLKNNPHAIAL